MVCVVLMQYLPERMGCLKQQLCEGSQPRPSAMKQVHPCCKAICVCATFLKEAATVVQNGSRDGGKRAVEIALHTQDESVQKAADAGKTYTYLVNVMYFLLITSF